MKVGDLGDEWRLLGAASVGPIEQSIGHPGDRRAGPNGAQDRGPLAALERLAAGLPAEQAGRLRKVGAEIEGYVTQLQEQHRRTLDSYAELAGSGQVLLGVESEFRAALAAIRDAAAATAACPHLAHQPHGPAPLRALVPGLPALRRLGHARGLKRSGPGGSMPPPARFVIWSGPWFSGSPA